jgi:hypothetical protein
MWSFLDLESFRILVIVVAGSKKSHYRYVLSGGVADRIAAPGSRAQGAEKLVFEI